MSVTIQGYVHDADGNPVNSATVNVYPHIDGTPTGSPTATTTTDANGKFVLSGLANSQYDVSINDGLQVYWWKGLTQMTMGDTYHASVTTSGAATVGGNAAISGTLTVTGLTTLNSGLTVVGTVTLPASSITNAMIASGAVDNGKIANAAVDSTKLAANAVATANIQDNAIVSAKIAAGAVGNPQLANYAVASQNYQPLYAETGGTSVSNITVQDPMYIDIMTTPAINLAVPSKVRVTAGLSVDVTAGSGLRMAARLYNVTTQEFFAVQEIMTMTNPNRYSFTLSKVLTSVAAGSVQFKLSVAWVGSGGAATPVNDNRWTFISAEAFS